MKKRDFLKGGAAAAVLALPAASVRAMSAGGRIARAGLVCR